MILTFFNNKIHPDIPKYQKKVMNHFNINIDQITPKNWGTHASEIDNYIYSINKKWEYLVLFDVDCIPLDNNIVNEGISWSMDNYGIFSVAQYASHIPNSIIYASPAFMIFSKKTYDLLGNPKFIQTNRADCGGELTYACLEQGFSINLLYPSHIEQKKWKLGDNDMFGLGTTYGDRVYHHFEARRNRVDSFIKKCNTVLNGYK